MVCAAQGATQRLSAALALARSFAIAVPALSFAPMATPPGPVSKSKKFEGPSPRGKGFTASIVSLMEKWAFAPWQAGPGDWHWRVANPRQLDSGFIATAAPSILLTLGLHHSGGIGPCRFWCGFAEGPKRLGDLPAKGSRERLHFLRPQSCTTAREGRRWR